MLISWFPFFSHTIYITLHIISEWSGNKASSDKGLLFSSNNWLWKRKLWTWSWVARAQTFNLHQTFQCCCYKLRLKAKLWMMSLSGRRQVLIETLMRWRREVGGFRLTATSSSARWADGNWAPIWTSKYSLMSCCSGGEPGGFLMGRTRCAGEGLRRSEHAVTQIPCYGRAVMHTCLLTFFVLLGCFILCGGNCCKAGWSQIVRGHLWQETGPMNALTDAQMGRVLNCF